MEQKNDFFGTILIVTLFILLTIAGVISYKSIDWNVLKKIESQTIILPSPVPTSISTNSAISSSSATVSSSKQ